MSIMSGFITWIIETWENHEEFPRSFLVGWFEGFWWSFISMTTVGYGDKTPKSIAAKIFCVIWVLVGVTSFCMLTATLTGELMMAKSPPEPSMKGAKVGVLKYREYDMYVVAQRGGIAVEYSSGDFVYDLVGLMEKLQKKELDGFVLDKYTLSFAETLLTGIKKEKESSSFERRMIEFFLSGTLRHEKTTAGESFSYGMLVREKKVYDFLVDVLQDNRIHFETKLALKLNKIEKSVEGRAVMFSYNDPNFILSLKFLMAVLSGFVMFGVIYEMRRNRLLVAGTFGFIRFPICIWNKKKNGSTKGTFI